MPIRFTCPHCHKRLGIGSRKAGAPIHCPVCAGSLTVPRPDTGFREEHTPAPRPLPSVELAPRPAEPDEPASNWSHRQLVGLGAGLAAVLVAVVVTVAVQRQQSPPEPAAPEPVQLAEFAPNDEALSPAPADDKLQLVAQEPQLAPPNQINPEPVVAPEFKVETLKTAAPVLPIFRPPTEPAQVAEARPRVPSPAAEPEPLPELMKVKVVRRHFLTDEELRKQLLAAPALSLEHGPAGSVFTGTSGRQPKPVQLTVALLQQRPDLAGLSMRMGNDCRLGKEAAENLQFLSRKLREHVTTAGKDGDPRKAEDHLRRIMLEQDRRSWVQAEAIPTLEQMLQVENKPIRLLLVEILTQIPDATASVALARRALFDLSAEVREAAIQALVGRTRAEFRSVLVDGLRYPWAPVADHAAEALVALQDRGVVTQLVKLVEQPDATAGFVVMPQKRTGPPTEPPVPANLIDKPTLMVREMVRINHLSNCLMCHAQSSATTDLVRGLVPDPNVPIQTTVPYYSGDQGIFVRADMTYVKQDFSVPQPVEKPGPWPQQQRYDYMVRTRQAMAADVDKRNVSGQREALLYALSQLEPDWKGRRQR